jgi:hypothetical protein
VSAEDLPAAKGGRELKQDKKSELARAVQVQALLRSLHPEEHHANCHVWAIFRAVGL